MSEMNEYEKLMYEKELGKEAKEEEARITAQKNSKIIGLVILGFMVLLIVAFTYSAIKNLFINPDNVENVVRNEFSNGEPYPPVNGMIDHENGWIVVSANADNFEDGLIKLRKAYNKFNRKFSTKKVDKIMIAVYKYSGADWGLMTPYKTGQLLFTSNIWVKDLKSTDWENIKTYDEFKEKANIN